MAIGGRRRRGPLGPEVEMKAAAWSLLAVLAFVVMVITGIRP